jgi:hypothetical protein
MVHDLEHAWKFFHNPDMHLAQREFFRVLADSQQSGCFNEYFRDPVFAAKFDYLSSDMNTHTMHASQFLRAILVEYHARREGATMPEDLSQNSQNAVAAVMISLFGEDWLAEVERRMMFPQKRSSYSN